MFSCRMSALVKSRHLQYNGPRPVRAMVAHWSE